MKIHFGRKQQEQMVEHKMWGLDVDGWWECEGKGNEKTKSGRRTKRAEKKVYLSPPSLKS